MRRWAIAPGLPGATIAVLDGYSPVDGATDGVVPVLNDLTSVDLWTAHARAVGRATPAILHLDTGMARLGLAEADVERLAVDPARLDGLHILFMMTHLVSSEITDDPLNAAQPARFGRPRASVCPRRRARSQFIRSVPRTRVRLRPRPGRARR